MTTHKELQRTKEEGFTIIELLIYLGLFSVIIGGALVGAYQIVESSGRNQSKIVLEQEANFMLKKTEWILNGSTLMLPSEGDSSNALVVENLGRTYELFLDDGALKLKSGASDPVSVTTENVSVDSATFRGLPGGVEAQYALTSKDYSRTYSFTRSLRQ
jgi:type II secretory pathway pseudopilin PulG